MKKKILKGIAAVLLIPVVLFSPLILLYTAFLIPLPFLSLSAQVERYQIRNEIFDFVRENKDIIVLKNSNLRQKFLYTATGLQDGGIEYGYFYDPNDEYAYGSEPYRTGYRTDGIPDDDTDWIYEERICENWFYYEIHDG